jgi:mannose-1-phosphate guanylyltransferase
MLSIGEHFMTLIPLILSGGAGTRLWPLSCGEGHRFMVAQQIG